MKNSTLLRCAILPVCLGGLAACGDEASHPDSGNAAGDSGICGTHDNPGILKLANLTPAFGAKVANHAIAHGFTVVRAPAQFSNFELKFAATHTAGLPRPEKPKFQMTAGAGSDLLYQLTIDSWSRSPGHVELIASGGFDTSAGCSWNFPSPLFSYDIVGGIDGGAAPEAGGGRPLDATADVAIDSAATPDRPGPVDLAVIDAGVDTTAAVDASASPDVPLAAIDGGAGS